MSQTPPMSPGKRIARRTINFVARTLTGIVCDIDNQGLDRIPLMGPAIVIVNHVNYLELPIIYSRARTMVATGYSKIENWDNPLFGLVFDNWDLIPLVRGEADVTAMRKGFEALDANKVLFITPEGTRSHHGRMQQAKPGIVLMALRSGAPVWPIACYGGEAFSENIKRLRRTDYHVVVGEPFTVVGNGSRITREVRQKIVDEMMYQIAGLMPEPYRGHYTDVDNASEAHLRFSDPAQSNLPATRSGPLPSVGEPRPPLP